MNPLEDDYKAFLKKINLERARVGAIMTGGLVMIFSVLDFFSYPDYAKTFFLLRLVDIALMLIVLAISYTKLGLSYGKAFGIFEMSITGIMINTMIRYTGYESPYYAGLNLVVLAIGVMYPWGFKETLLTTGFVYICYVVPILLFDKISNVILFVNNNIFLLATIVIASSASFFASSLRRREFIGRYQLEEAKISIEASYEKLQEYNRLKSRFFANVSHELRTPTTLILGPAEMLINHELGLVTADQQKYLHAIHRNATRLLNIINRLLDLMKSELGSVALASQRGDFVAFTREIVQAVIPAADKKSLTLSFSGGQLMPEFFFDKEKMEEVIFNLLGNALKFTESGEIAVSCSQQWGSVLVKVTDTGIGISEEHISKIFDRFYQVDAALSTVGRGMGLGLSLVKEWVELHNGRIWVESKLGEGSVFQFTIPMQMTERIDGPPRIWKEGEERREKERRMLLREEFDVGLEPPQEKACREGVERILIVDDMPEMIDFISDQLKTDYNCCFARDGAEGIDRARVEQPDLIISDIMMPVKDGYQLCRELKNNPETTFIPIIFLTAKGSLSDRIEGLEEGVDDYLCKPFNREELRARVRSVLLRGKLQKEVLLKNGQLEDALAEVRRTGNDLAQSNKMASLGLLVAGVAHELNNPISFAKGSLLYVHRIFDTMGSGSFDPKGLSDIRRDVKQSLDIVKNGLLRAEAIVKSLSSFVRKDEAGFTNVDIHAGLDVTLEFLKYDWKPGIEIHRDYGAMPLLVEAIPGQLNQVFMNILQNAIHAMGSHGKILIKTDLVGDDVSVSIRDSGQGIPEESISKIFQPFFTTKEVGKGTGLGLSLAYGMVVDTHHGKINVKSKIGEGSEFIITLPVKQPKPTKGTVYAGVNSL